MASNFVAHGRVDEARFDVLLAIPIASKVRFVLHVVSPLKLSQRIDPLSVDPTLSPSSGTGPHGRPNKLGFEVLRWISYD